MPVLEGKRCVTLCRRDATSLFLWFHVVALPGMLAKQGLASTSLLYLDEMEGGNALRHAPVLCKPRSAGVDRRGVGS